MKKFLKKVGNTYLDAMKGTADFTLSAFGAKDVISDDAYKTKFGKNVIDKVANTAGGISGQVAAGVLLGPAGAAAMTGLQQGVGAATDQVEPDPSMLAKQKNATYANQMAAMQPQQTITPTFKCGGSMKKLQDGGSINRWVIDNTKIDRDKYTLPNGNIVPKAEFEKYMNVPIDQSGKILPPLKGTKTTDYHPFRGLAPPSDMPLSAQFGVPPRSDINTDFVRGYKYGGSMKSYADGGMLQEYSGQTHNGPDEGIPIDQSGNPQALTGEQPVALVEDNETRWEDYIFSDSIKLPGNKKRTFADESKRIKKKYELRLGKDLEKKDPIDTPALAEELNTLMELQETLKGNMVHQEDAQAMMQEQEQAMMQQMQQQPQGMQQDPIMQQEQMPMEQPMMKYGGDLPKYKYGVNPDIPEGERLATGAINPVGLIAPVIGNITGMIGESRRKNIPLNLGRMQAQRANLNRSRQDISNQAASARGSIGSGLRQAGATGSQYMSGILAGNTAIAGQSGSQLAGITTQEEQMNMQARAQADAANMQAQSQEQMWRAQQEGASQDRTRQYRDSISQGIGQYFVDDATSRRAMAAAQMSQPEYAITEQVPTNFWQKSGLRRTPLNRRYIGPTNSIQ